MRGKLWLAVALCPALMASQCIEPAYVGVQQGPRPADPPAFDFAYDGAALTYVEEFQVADCRGASRLRAPMWRIEREGQPPADIGPLRITYGRAPRGYRETTAAKPLEPGGCYDATVEVLAPVGVPIRSPAGKERFRLLPTGRLVVGYPGGLINNSRPFRELNRAAVGCTRGWRRADTATDSARVAAREYVILDARVSCDWLYTRWPDLVDEPLATERATLSLAGLVTLFISLGLLLEYLPDPPQ